MLYIIPHGRQGSTEVLFLILYLLVWYKVTFGEALGGHLVPCDVQGVDQVEDSAQHGDGGTEQEAVLQAVEAPLRGARVVGAQRIRDLGTGWGGHVTQEGAGTTLQTGSGKDRLAVNYNAYYMASNKEINNVTQNIYKYIFYRYWIASTTNLKINR